MEKKEDRRVTMTKRLLKNALTDLLKEKDIYHISIRELCDNADVNRTTFYKYYGSQFDLLADMEADMIGFIQKAVTRNESRPEMIIENVCRYLEDNLEFARLIINNNIDPAFPQKIFSLEIIKKIAFKNYADKNDRAEMEYRYNFITYGAFRIVCLWLNKEQRESPDKLATLILKQTMIQ